MITDSIAVAYGPSTVRAKVGKGEEVTITEETDYPFDGTVRFRIKSDKPVKIFILHEDPGLG